MSHDRFVNMISDMQARTVGDSIDQDMVFPWLLIDSMRRGKTVFPINDSFHVDEDPEKVFSFISDALGGLVSYCYTNVEDGKFGLSKTSAYIVSDKHSLYVQCGGGRNSLKGVSCKVRITGASNDQEAFATIYEYLHLRKAEFPPPKPNTSGVVHALIMGMRGIEIKQIGSAGVTFEPGNYNPRVVEDYRFVTRDIVSRSPTGRLAIFSGEPGTGKTHLVQAMLKDPSVNFLIVDSGSIKELQGPQLLPVLVDHKNSVGKPIVLVLEDGDDAIRKREKDASAGLVSSLLNMSDGILGKVIDIRILVTSNLAETNIDEAARRPGRLIRHIRVDALDPEIAELAFKRLTGKDKKINLKTSLASVYAMAREDGWEPSKEAEEPEGDSDDEDDDLAPVVPRPVEDSGEGALGL